MIQRADYIESVATQGSKKLWDEEYRVFFEYFPRLDGVYVETEGETFWFWADGISEAREKYLSQHVIYNKIELKAV